jgi:hypothetical protein
VSTSDVKWRGVVVCCCVLLLLFLSVVACRGVSWRVFECGRVSCRVAHWAALYVVRLRLRLRLRLRIRSRLRRFALFFFVSSRMRCAELPFTDLLYPPPPRLASCLTPRVLPDDSTLDMCCSTAASYAVAFRRVLVLSFLLHVPRFIFSMHPVSEREREPECESKCERSSSTTPQEWFGCAMPQMTGALLISQAAGFLVSARVRACVARDAPTPKLLRAT